MLAYEHTILTTVMCMKRFRTKTCGCRAFMLHSEKQYALYSQYNTWLWVQYRHLLYVLYHQNKSILSFRCLVAFLLHKLCVLYRRNFLALKNVEKSTFLNDGVAGMLLLLVVFSACGGIRTDNMCQFWLPTFPCWLMASWERVGCSWHHH